MFAAVALVASTLVFGLGATPAAALAGASGTVGPPTATTFGNTVTFSGQLSNTGTGAVEDFTSVTFTDDGSTGLTLVSAAPLGAVPAGATVPFTATAQISGAPGSAAVLRLKAHAVTADAATADPDAAIGGSPFTVTDAVVLEVTAERVQGVTASPCLLASCTVSIDDSLRYTVKVTNVSQVPVTDVKITAPAPSNTTDVPASSTIPTGPFDLVAGESRTFVREVTVNDPATDAVPPQPGDVLTFNAAATYDATVPSVLNDEPAGGSPASFPATVSDPRLTIANVLTDDNGAPLGRGDPVLSTITIDNTGNLAATNTVVTANLTNLTTTNPSNPPNVKINGVAAPPGQVDITPTSVTVRIGTGTVVGPPATGGTVAPADPNIVVTFVSSVIDSPTGAPALAQSTASVSFDNGGVSPKTATAVPLPILPPPNVSLVITATPPPPGPVARSSNITYVITATNSGPGPVDKATGVTISFPVPTQTTLAVGIPPTASAGGSPPTAATPIETTFPTLASGASATLTVTVTVDPAAVQTVGAANDIVANASVRFGPGPTVTVNAAPVAHEISVAQLNLTSTLTDLDGGQLLRGQVVESTVTVDNTGTANATNTVVTIALTNLGTPSNIKIGGIAAPASQVDVAPGQLTVRIGSGAGAATGGTITPAQAPIAISFNATVVPSPTGTPPQAQTSASVTFGNGGSSNSPVVSSIEIMANPAVSLSITPTPPVGTSVPRNSDITYVVTASNAAGNAAAQNVAVSFPIPANTTFVSASAAGGSVPAGFPAGPITTTFATIPAGGSAALTVVVHVVASPTKVAGSSPANDIVATASANYGPGSNPTATAAPVAHEISAADLKLSLSPATQSIQKNKPASLTATVDNLGPDPATGTKTVTINLTGVGTIQTAPGCIINGASTQAVCSSTAVIASGGSMAFPFTVIHNAPGTATLTASLVATGIEVDEVPGNNGSQTATVNFQQSASDLSITASGPVALVLGSPTQNVTYTLSVSDPDPLNPNDAAEGVVVAIPIPASVRATAATYAGAANGSCTVPAGSGGTVTCASIGNIVDNGVVTLTLTLQGTALQPAPAPVTATATATNDDPTTPNKATVNVTVGPQPVDISVSDLPANTVIPTSAAGTTVGAQIFTITVNNNTAAYPTAGYTLRVETDPAVAASALALSSTAVGCTTATNVVTCTGTGLASGAPKSFDVKVDIKTPGPIALRSTVTLVDPSQVDPQVGNNTDTWGVELAAADLTLAISPAQSIQKMKFADVTVTLGNSGPRPSTGTKTVTVDLTGAGTLQSGDCTVTGGNHAVCTVPGAIAAGASVPLLLKVKSDGPGTATLTASLTSATGLESDVNTGNNATVTTTVAFQQSSTDLSITAGAPVALNLVTPALPVTYTLAVNDPDAPPNNNDPAEGVTVTIPIPGALQATAATFPGAPPGACAVPPGPGGTVTCTIGNIPAGATVTITLTLKGTTLLPVAAPVAATAASTNNDPNLANNTASVLVTVLPQPVDLSVNDRPANTIIPTVGAGTMVGTQTFPVTVTNLGALYTAGSYTLTIDPIPFQPATVVALTSPTAGCTAAGNIVTCTGTNLAPGATQSFDIKVDINDPGPFTLRSTVTLTDPGQVDPVAADNTDTWGVQLAAADLALAVAPASQPIQKRKPADVTVTVTNGGPQPATGTKTVTIDLTGSGAIQPVAGCTVNPAGSQAICAITAAIASGGSVALPLKVVSDTPGTATLTASLVATGRESDENPGNNVAATATVTFLQSSSDVSVTASGAVALIFDSPTQTVTYTVSNHDLDPAPNSGDPAEGVKLTIQIPAQLRATAAAFPGAPPGACVVPAGSGGTVTCTIGDIADGGVVPVTLTLQGTALLPVAAQVTATATVTNSDPAVANDAASVAVTVLPQPVDLSVNDLPSNTIIPTVGPGTKVGTQTFTVVVSNGSAAYTAGSYSLRVEPDPIQPATVVALTSATAGCTAAGNIVTCTGTNLAPGATRSFDVKVDINDPGPFTLRSTVTLAGPTQADLVPANNTDTWGVQLAAADLVLGISPASQSIQKRKPADVTVTVTNGGPQPATGTKTVTINLTGSGAIQSAAGCTVNPAGSQAICAITATIASGGNVALPIKVVSDTPGTATLSASLLAGGVESDEDATNNAVAVATVTFLQSASDLSVTPSGAVALIFDTPTQTVTYTVSNHDLDPAPNNGDPAEGVQVTIQIPPALRATEAAFTGTVSGSCSVPAGSGGTVTCSIGDLADGGVVPITLTLQGTALLPAATQVTATATLTNNDPAAANNAASVAVTVLPQPIDLSVNDVADATIQTPSSGATIGARDFTVTVKNNGPSLPAVQYPTGPYTLTVTASGPEVVLAGPGCTPPGASVVTCTGSGLAPGATKDFVITATISADGPITITATVALGLPTQLDAVAANNTDTWKVIRNIPPAAGADLGPTVPAGATLLYDVLSNDSDLDVPDKPNFIVTLGAPVAGATVTVESKKLKVVVAGDAAPGVLDVAYTIADNRGGVATTSLKVRVVGPLVKQAEGSFGLPPSPAPRTFGSDIAPDRISGETPTQVNVLEGALGKRADDTAYPPAVDYDLTDVSKDSLNVTGSDVNPQDVAGRNVVRYVPAKGYTSDPGGLPKATAPPDDFTYVTKAMVGSAELFRVDAMATVQVRNQNPIGVDNTFDVPNGVTQKGFPATNDIDGNTVKAPIAVKRPNGSFVFDDEGVLNKDRRLKISCIGPLPDRDSVNNLPTVAPESVCPANGSPAAGWKKPGEELVLETTNSKGKVTVKLLADGDDAFRGVTMTADATVVGRLDFAYVVADNYGGAGFGLASANVPNTKPQVIEGVRTVLKNTPTVVVDTKLAAQDANGDTIEISSAPERTEHGKVGIGDNNRTITYTPDKDYLGPDKLLYNVSDGRADGAASAELQLNVIEQPTDLTVAGTGAAAGGGAGGGAAAGGSAAKGALPKTGGDPVLLTLAGACSMALGLALVQAGRRRRTRPLLAQARHLRP